MKIPLLLFAILALLAPVATAQPVTVQAEVYFSPDGGCTDAIVREINAAEKTIHVMAYSFTSAAIAKALTEAHKRGVTVEVILDKSQRTAKYTSATFLHNAGIPTWIDSKHAIQHNKTIVIDSTTVITGSFNFSTAAETRNAENLLMLRGDALAKKYLENWQLHRGHASSYQRSGK